MLRFLYQNTILLFDTESDELKNKPFDLKERYIYQFKYYYLCHKCEFDLLLSNLLLLSI